MVWFVALRFMRSTIITAELTQLNRLTRSLIVSQRTVAIWKVLIPDQLSI
jgi:hypothetical protein